MIVILLFKSLLKKYTIVLFH
uniref:Uncharacterized protein n=1 Tax=Anguilla anguilla TaxID=7936 RepID=A0A0E9RPN8_ANGAN